MAQSKTIHANEAAAAHRYCAARFPKEVKPKQGMNENRIRLIRETSSKWMNGTTLKYWFYKSPQKWTAAEDQKDVVREAFRQWKVIGIGLDFLEVPNSADADIRIAFDQSDGSWSYIGTDCLSQPKDEQTMNFGWSLTEDSQNGIDTALHEIGHAIGFPHEHQNPFAGIVWDEPKVYAALKAPPNNWSRATTFHNIIEKIVPDTVQGSTWDPNSIMHYPFDGGLILKPTKYNKGLTPKGGISTRDKSWVRKFYPPLTTSGVRALNPFISTPLKIKSTQQAEFLFTAPTARSYTVATFGVADTRMALEKVQGNSSILIAEDDDSGNDRNASASVRLKKGDQIRVKIRMRFIEQAGEAAVMVW